MAWRWRIRHKLVLGLGLVVSVLALLLAGTVNGLLAYYDTIRTFESKLAEVNAADALRSSVNDLKAKLEAETRNTSPAFEKIHQVAASLNAYEERLTETIEKGRDPDMGYLEKMYLVALRKDLTDLHQAMTLADGAAVEQFGDSRGHIFHPEVKKAITKLETDAGDLRQTIYGEFYRRSDEAKGSYRSSMIFVISTTVIGVLLMVGLLRFFYCWVFYPVRDLEQGAGRVAHGDFGHRIEVHSGDEMEDLAAAFNDMTGRLREMYRDLEHQVNERSRQLVRSEHLASVGFLAAGVAHEINNPLASIAFCSEALEARLADALARQPTAESETVTKYLQMIQKAAFRCKEITQKLLEFSRSGERRREPTDLAELVQSVLDLVQHLPNCKGKRIIFDPPARLVAAVNGQEINSVVLNLVVNALDSMDEGGTLTILLHERDGRAEMVFADTGCGMPREVLENIFEPFFTRSRTGKGTGLGLSISHRIISQHDGEIEATSTGLGHGSTFTVRLPLRSAEQESGVRGQDSGGRDTEAGAEFTNQIAQPARRAA